MDAVSVAEVYEEITPPALRLLPTAALLVILLFASIIMGFLSGRRQRQRLIETGKDTDDASGEASIGAILASLGLLLAFSVSNAASLLDTRKRTSARDIGLRASTRTEAS